MGQLVGPMVWLVPQYPEKPGTIIRLGSILTDPTDIESSLNLDAIPSIPEGDKRDASTAVRRQVQTELSKSDSLFAKAVPSIASLFGAEIGASAGAGRERGSTTTLDAHNVRATVFIPSEAFMETALNNERVRKYAQKVLFRKPLYVVVGVATASGVTMGESQSASRFVEGSAIAALPGGLGEGEAGFEHRHTAGSGSNVEVDEPCDFAYRAREFYYSKVRGLVNRGNVTESALFGKDDQSTIKNDVEFEPKFEWFQDEDATVPDLACLAIPDDG